MKPKFYLTTPIYYVNARPHLGHTYTTIVADTIARYKRMRGFDVVMLTGTDEHGQKIERAARAAGLTPEQLTDRVSAEYRVLWDELALRYDRFIRTTEDRHERAVHNFWLKIRDAGYLYKGHYEGQYCFHDELYVDEPLPGGLCPDCKRPTELVREENYYFKLSEFQDRLLQHYEQHPEFIQPDARRNEVIAFVRGGLRDLSVSRTSLKWGVPWPEDDRHVCYVWADALLSYMSGIGYGDDEVQWERYWPADLHLVGKEIIRFHCVYWPAFLMAASEPLPKQVYAHGLWLMGMEKMSKSRGNIALAQPIARILGMDALRYFCLREMVFGQDSNFSYEALVTRYNADLANGLGNLASRTLTMIHRYCNGKVPDRHYQPLDPWRPTSKGMPDLTHRTRDLVLLHFDHYAFSNALETIWGLIRELDGYLSQQKPWVLAEDAAGRTDLERVLYNTADTLRYITILAYPVLPSATEKLWALLGQAGKISEARIDNLSGGQLEPGTQLGPVEPIFPRVEKDETIERIETMDNELRQPTAPSATAAAPAAAPAHITIDDFAKVEMRVGQVKSAERVAGADKLLKIMVDIGTEVRQIVAGIAEVYQPDALVGRKVVVVVNLQPRKLRGVESNGMIVAASVPPEGKPVLAGFLEDVPVGSRLK